MISSLSYSFRRRVDLDFPPKRLGDQRRSIALTGERPAQHARGRWPTRPWQVVRERRRLFVPRASGRVWVVGAERP